MASKNRYKNAYIACDNCDTEVGDSSCNVIAFKFHRPYCLWTSCLWHERGTMTTTLQSASYAALLSKVNVNNLLNLFMLINYFIQQVSTYLSGRFATVLHVYLMLPCPASGKQIQFDWRLCRPFPIFTLGNGGNSFQWFTKNRMQYG